MFPHDRRAVGVDGSSMPAPPFNRNLYDKIDNVSHDEKVARYGYAHKAAQQRSRKGWADGEGCLASRIKTELGVRLVPPAERRGGPRKWYDAEGKAVTLKGLFGKSPGACFPTQLCTFQNYLRLYEEG